MLRYSTVAVAQRTPRTRKWVWTGATIAATAGVAALTASGPIDQHEQGASSHDQLQQPISALDRLQQQLQKAASLIWPSHSTPTDSPQPSITTAALNRARATSARWLAQWAVDPDAREALLAFGSNKLLDFLIDTATDDPSPEQVHAEQALCNFLQGYHTSTRLLARPGAISRLLEHIAAGKASDALVERLTALATNRGADLSEGLSQEDGKELIGMLSGGHGQQVQSLALKFLTAWSSAGGPPQCRQLSQSGLAAALGQLAMEAVTQGDQGRQLQKAVCRCQRALLSEPSAVPDEQLATWMQPLLFMAADAAASAAAAAAASGGKYPYGGLGSSVDGSSSSGGVLGLPGSAADLAVADVAMTTLGAVVAAGGPQVKAALADLHVMPTLDCLALSQDPAIRARAAAALAALVTAGNLEVEEASGRWTDMLLSWLISSTVTVLQKRESSSGGGSSSSGWLLGGLFSSSSSSDGGDVTGSAASGGRGDVGDEALARSCVAALRALSQQPGPVGLSVAQQWLARILLQLSSRVAAYTSITTLAPANGSSSGGSSRRGDVPAAALKAAGAVALADSATTGMVANPLIKDAAAALRESSSSSSSSSSRSIEHSSSLESPDAVAAVADTQSDAAGSSNSGSWWWWLGGRWWYGSPTDTTSSSSSSTNPDDASSTSPNDLWAQLEAAKEAAWRDAAPVTPASAKAAADDLKAASNAMLSSWKGTAALALPSDLVPGMFVPAVEEAYPAAARVVDYAVAQQQTIHVMEILASVVAEDPTKQSWLLAAGILPLMERLVLHEDAALQPDAFVSKYSSSGSSGGSNKGKGDKQQQSASDSTEVGSSSRWWWSWWGASNSSSSSDSDSANAPLTQYSSTNFVRQQPYVGVFPGAAIAPNAQIVHSTVQQQHAFDNDNRTDFDRNQNLHSFRDDAATQQHAGSSSQYSSSSNNSSSSAKRDVVIDDADHNSSSSGNYRDQSSGKRMQKLHCEFGIEVDDVGDGDDVIGSPKDTAAATAGSIGSWVADGIISKFTAAAWSTTTSSSSSDVGRSKSAAAAAPAGAVDEGDDTKMVADQNNNSSSQYVLTAAENEPAAAAAAQEDQSSTTPAAAAAAAKSYTPHYIPSTIHMEFAQGTASWDYVTSDVSYSLNPSSSHSSPNPNKALDTATALTAAAEEAPSLSDGDGLGFLCLQRQVARILSMLALQPVAALQLAESALGFSNGAVGVLQDMESKPGFKRQKDNKGSIDLSPRPPAATNPGKRIVQRTGSSSNGSSSGQWLPWLLAAAASDDCLLASYATIGLLHLESAVAHQLHQQQQQQQSVTHHSSSSSTSWQQRLAQELQAAEEDIAALIEELWPFGSTAASSSSSSDQGVWRPPVYYPDGIHLLNPDSSHHWGLLQPPRATLLESLGAAAANAAATAAAAAASDLAQSEIEGLPVPRVPDAADVASAAAAAATAAANALGADVSQLGHLQHGSSNENASGGSSSSSENACDLGLLQPAIVWLARKLVHLAAVKEEQIHEQQQQQQKGLSSSSSDPSAPLSTYAALQALLLQMDSDSSSVATAKPTSEQQQQQELAGGYGSSMNMTAAATQAPQPPDVDIIFIHGIRGGPFVTWRRGGLYKHAPSSSSSSSRTVGRIADPAVASDEDGSSSSGVPLSPTAAAAAHRNHMTKGDCWPAAWLAADLPNARILSLEYKAPVTGWEGESLSLPDSGRLLLEKLVAAGVGQRPVVFVAHSMGGLIVKEMLSQSLEEPPTSRKGRVAAATRAVAFYSTPHFGSGMAALGWKLRHLPGASPAPSIHHLSPGPHLSALNARLALLHESGRVQVLSFTEGLATNLAGLGFLPKIVIVPYESAYPGFGEVCVLADKDHIDVCKPESREKLAYSKLLEFVRASGAVEDAAEKTSSSSSTEQQAACRGADDVAVSCNCEVCY